MPGESQGQRSLAGYSSWDPKSRTRLSAIFLSFYKPRNAKNCQQTIRSWREAQNRLEKNQLWGIPGSPVVRIQLFQYQGLGSVPESGRSPGAGNGNPLQYSRLENPRDRGAWLATVHGVAKSQPRLSAHTAWGDCVRTQGREAPQPGRHRGDAGQLECGAGAEVERRRPDLRGAQSFRGLAPPGGVGVYS